jgi:hypothetical protein
LVFGCFSSSSAFGGMVHDKFSYPWVASAAAAAAAHTVGLSIHFFILFGTLKKIVPHVPVGVVVDMGKNALKKKRI